MNNFKFKNMSKKQKLDWMDIEEIASSICKIESEESSEIEDALYEKYEVSSEQYEKIVSDLFDRIDFGISPLTDETFIGFSNEEQNVWLAKKQISPKFISAVIQWLTGGEEIKPTDKGFARIITSGGKSEFEISIKRAVEETVSPSGT